MKTTEIANRTRCYTNVRCLKSIFTSISVKRSHVTTTVNRYMDKRRHA